MKVRYIMHIPYHMGYGAGTSKSFRGNNWCLEKEKDKVMLTRTPMIYILSLV